MKIDAGTYAKILDNLYDGLYIVDVDRVISYWNKGAERITGYTSAEVIGRACKDNILTHIDGQGKCLCLGGCPLLATITDGQERKDEVYLHHKDGHRILVYIRSSVLKDESGKVLGGIELFSDLGTLCLGNARMKELEKLALLDNLTQLANRIYLEREMHARFEEFKRFKVPFGIFFIDIDHFKSVNDRFGHDVGDRVLKFIAATFLANSRPFDVYGRWGGEEFIGIIRNIGSEDLVLLGNRLRVLIEHSYIVHQDQKLSIKVSIGATMAREDDNIEKLLKRADTLLYESKDKGRNRLTLG